MKKGKRKKGKFKKAKSFFKLTFATFVLFSAGFLGIQIYVDSVAAPYLCDTENAPLCDAVMVLGASVYSDGTPSKILEDRLLNAYSLYKSGKAKIILVSGDHASDDYNEVGAMRDYLVSLGVPATDVFTDDKGFDTYESMYRAKNVFKTKSLLVSTQNFHISRAVYIARRLGIVAYGCPCGSKNPYSDDKMNLRESFAKVKAVMETEILKKLPKFIPLK